MNTVWVFDVDGVIVNIEKEIITEPFILNSIIKILEKGEVVALNTGRGIDWTLETVLNPLKSKITNPAILKNLFISSESGGITATFDKNGSLQVTTDDSLKIPRDLDKKVRELVTRKYSKSMRYENKKTMSTTKIKEGTSIEKFQEDQETMIGDLQRIINSSNLRGRLKVDISTIGTNIMYKRTGKDLGIELILKWLKDMGIKPEKFIAFGDSASDIPMAEKLYENGCDLKFVFVGGKNKIQRKAPYKIHTTESLFDKGTVEFLKSL